MPKALLARVGQRVALLLGTPVDAVTARALCPAIGFRHALGERDIPEPDMAKLLFLGPGKTKSLCDTAISLGRHAFLVAVFGGMVTEHLRHDRKRSKHQDEWIKTVLWHVIDKVVKRGHTETLETLLDQMHAVSHHQLRAQWRVARLADLYAAFSRRRQLDGIRILIKWSAKTTRPNYPSTRVVTYTPVYFLTPNLCAIVQTDSFEFVAGVATAILRTYSTMTRDEIWVCILLCAVCRGACEVVQRAATLPGAWAIFKRISGHLYLSKVSSLSMMRTLCAVQAQVAPLRPDAILDTGLDLTSESWLQKLTTEKDFLEIGNTVLQVGGETQPAKCASVEAARLTIWRYLTQHSYNTLSISFLVNHYVAKGGDIGSEISTLTDAVLFPTAGSRVRSLIVYVRDTVGFTPGQKTELYRSASYVPTLDAMVKALLPPAS